MPLSPVYNMQKQILRNCPLKVAQGSGQNLECRRSLLTLKIFPFERPSPSLAEWVCQPVLGMSMGTCTSSLLRHAI
jgi:hypothetical protein